MSEWPAALSAASNTLRQMLAAVFALPQPPSAEQARAACAAAHAALARLTAPPPAPEAAPAPGVLAAVLLEALFDVDRARARQPLQADADLENVPASAAELFESALQLPLCRALSRALAPCPRPLFQAMASAKSAWLKDALCEVAGDLPLQADPAQEDALMHLLVAHLQHNPFVAALSLAAHGNPAALPHLQALLQHLLVQRHPATGAEVQDDTLLALHLEGLQEAIEDLGGQVDGALTPALARASARGRPSLDPLLALERAVP